MTSDQAPFDQIGYWLEMKLDIIREYAAAYSRILKKRSLQHIYIDAFAGAGVDISKTSGEFVPGSLTNALWSSDLSANITSSISTRRKWRPWRLWRGSGKMSHFPELHLGLRKGAAADEMGRRIAVPLHLRPVRPASSTGKS